ncbi:hypothetical protein ACFYYD_22465 [Streptomyces bluensis]|uniref:hypothetical protein n=1 Tax=Streptomyces bluensis TaxID=33897 RepID=UPI0036763BAB
MNTFHPTLISAADDLAATAPGKNDSWWFASRLHDEDGNVFWAKIHAMETEGACHGTVALVREADGHTSDKHTVEPLHDVKLSTDRLDVQTSVLNLSGGLDELNISGTTDTASIRLALRREGPVLFSGGSGLFPFFGGTTGQFALPGLIASGTLTVEGSHISSPDAHGATASGCPRPANRFASCGSDSTSERAAPSASGTPRETARPGSRCCRRTART